MSSDQSDSRAEVKRNNWLQSSARSKGRMEDCEEEPMAADRSRFSVSDYWVARHPGHSTPIRGGETSGSFGISRQSALRILCWSAISITIGSQSVCLLTNRWMESEELITNLNYVKFNMSVDQEFHSKFTSSGLWRICFTEIPGNFSTWKCDRIQYFTGEVYSPDPNDSTGAIPYAAKKAAFFMVISSCFMIFGAFFGPIRFVVTRIFCFCCCLLIRRRNKRRKQQQEEEGGGGRRSRRLDGGGEKSLLVLSPSSTSINSFISGIFFILSGLMVLASMVIYISTFKAEVGNKLRPKSSFQGPTFIYRYGLSFLFAVSSLILSEVTGTLLVFSFILAHRVKWKQSMILGLEFLEGQRSGSTIFDPIKTRQKDRRDHPHLALPITNKQLNQVIRQKGRRGQTGHSDPLTAPHDTDMMDEEGIPPPPPPPSSLHPPHLLLLRSPPSGSSSPSSSSSATAAVAAAAAANQHERNGEDLLRRAGVGAPTARGSTGGVFMTSSGAVCFGGGATLLSVPGLSEQSFYCKKHSRSRRYSRSRDLLFGGSTGVSPTRSPASGSPRLSLIVSPRGSFSLAGGAPGGFGGGQQQQQEEEENPETTSSGSSPAKSKSTPV